MFDEQADRNPDGEAVRCEGRSLSYAEFRERANRLAHFLRTLGVGPDVLVGISVERSIDMIVGLLGILKAGGAYVPLDPSYPRERLAFMIQDTKVPVILTQSHVADSLPPFDGRLIRLDGDWELVSSHPAVPPVGVGVNAEHLAYVTYTSGSTGRPKGVCVPHRAVVNFTQNANDAAFSREHTFLQLAPLPFDLSVFEIWGALANGGRLVVFPPVRVSPSLVADVMRRERVTTVMLSTGLFHQMVADDCLNGLGELRQMVVAGEALSAAHVRRAARALPNCRLINGYGPTEACVITTYYTVVDADALGASVPIGKPLANYEAYVLDSDSASPKSDEPGELFIGGDGLARGYLNRPELIAEKFVQNPFGKPGERLYRSGDLVRHLPDGNIEFLGRIDNQVKIRGFRVELGEVESRLAEHPGVKAAAVVAPPDPAGGRRLVAYVVPSGKDASPPAADLRAFVGERLPEYMVPSLFASIEKLPVTPNGKIDRRALESEVVQQPSTGFVPPEGETEKRIAAAWCEALGVDAIGRNDRFLDLGGHSLSAVQVVSWLSRMHGMDIPLRILLDNPMLAEAAKEMAVASGSSAITRTTPNEGVFPASYSQMQFWLLRQLGAHNSLPMRIRIDGPLDVAVLSRCFDELERRHKPLRTTFTYSAGTLQQVVHPPQQGRLSVTDLRGLDPSTRDSEAERVAAELCDKDFDLEVDVAWRAGLLVLGPERHLLILTMHHIITDRWSIARVLFPELESLYSAFGAGRPSPLPPLAIDYTDFALWEHDWLNSPAAEQRFAYWRERLKGSPASLDLPLARTRPAAQSFRSAVVPVSVPSDVTTGLKQLAQREGCTLFVVLLAAFQALLHRYSGQTDIVVGTPLANRLRPETHGLFGCLLNEVALRTDLSGNPSFRELLARVRTTTVGAMENELPFTRVVEAVRPERSSVHTPIFQVMMLLIQSDVEVTPRLADLRLSLEPDEAIGELDLVLQLEEGGKGDLFGFLEYDTDLFDEETAQRTARHFDTLLAAVVRSPHAPIGVLPLLPKAELDLIEQWSQSPAEPAAQPTIQEQLARQVRETPDAPALTYEDETLTYRELDRRTAALARRLRQAGAGPDVVCGLYADRSAEMVIGMLAILCAGAAYVPLDPSYPLERIALMLEDSRAPIVLVSPEMRGRLPRSRNEPVQIGTDDAEVSNAVELEPVQISDENLAYLIYTSGSTGRPKGVAVPHHALSNFLAGMDQRLGSDTAKGVWLAVTSVSFDISILELLWPLARGGHVVVARDPRELHRHPVKPDGRSGSSQAVDFSLFYFAADEGEGDSRDKYRLLMDGARFADTHGFSAVWTPERHFHPFGGIYPNPSVTSAALAMVTKRLRLRAGSVVLPLHHPVRVAEEWSVVDNLSQGRVELSFASGWQANDFVLRPENFAPRRELMYEGIAAVQKLWSGEALTLPDSSGRQIAVRLHPRPVQPVLPVWVTSAGAPETWERAGTMGAHVLTHLLGQSPEQVGEKVALYRQARARAGHDPQSGKVAVMLHTYIGEDLDTVYARVRTPFKRYLRSAGSLVASMAGNGGLNPELMTKDDWDALLKHHLDRYLQTSALIGTPDMCRRMVEWLRELGVTEVACLVDFGVPVDDALMGLHALDSLRRTTSTYRRPPRSLEELARTYRPTALQCTPTLAAAIAEDAELASALGSLRTWLIGGEVLPTSVVAEVRRALPSIRLFNMYGPTETTIWSTCHEVTDETSSSVPIGRPIRNTNVYVVDRFLNPVPIGVPGDLLIGGDGLARGYFEQPELTAERFILEPFNTNARAYRTGDVARFRPDGSLEYVGRGDTQVKIRGHRMELGEVEAVLGHHPAVRAAAVVARNVSPADVQAVAYVTFRNTAAASPADVREFLAKKLPDYMIPARFVVLDELPLTSNGKVNRQALPEALSEETGAAASAEPETLTERTLLEIWRDVLKTPQIGVDDDFFHVEGHSLRAVQVVVEIERELNIRVMARTVFEQRTVRKLARHIDALKAAAPSHYPASRMQKRFWELHQRGADEVLSLQIRWDGALDSKAFEEAFTELAARHKSLRAKFITVDGDLRQVFDPAPVRLDVRDLSGLREAEQQAAIDALGQEMGRPFDLEAGPPLRAVLLRLEPEQHLLALAIHHIVSDGWSVSRVLLPELDTIYRALARGQKSPLPRVPYDFVDCVALGQRQTTPEENVAYWTKHLSGCPAPLALRAGRQRPKNPTFRAARAGFVLSAASADALRTMAHEKGVTLFTLLFASFGLLLHAHSGAEDIVVGTPVSNRRRIEVDGFNIDPEPLVGRFLSYLPVRADLSGTPTFETVLQRVDRALEGAFAHEDLPCFAIEDAVRGGHGLDDLPLFRTVFQMDSAPAFTLNGARGRVQPGPIRCSQFDLSVEVREVENELAVDFVYGTDIFESYIEQLANKYRSFLSGLPWIRSCESVTAKALAGVIPSSR
ncbi:amino acid adenylation domain-containing protein [Sorangium sp. So ce1128]